MDKKKKEVNYTKVQKLKASVLRTIVWLSAGITTAILLALIGYILIKGIPCLKPSLFAWEYNTDNVSMMPAIINTITMVLLALLFSVPFGIGAAIYLVEYAKRGSKLVKIIRVTTETLAGIPSIVFGLFGFLAFVLALHWGYSLIAGVLTLAIMVLVQENLEQYLLLFCRQQFREFCQGLFLQ